MPVDSTKKQLSIPEIIVSSLKETGVEQKRIQPVLFSIIKEGSLPNSEVINFGNTVFISHYKKKEDDLVVYGRGLNADIAKNYMQNGEEYFKHLISKGVKYFVSVYDDPRINILFRYIARPEVQSRVAPNGKAIVETYKGKEPNQFISVVKLEV